MYVQGWDSDAMKRIDTKKIAHNKAVHNNSMSKLGIPIKNNREAIEKVLKNFTDRFDLFTFSSHTEYVKRESIVIA